MYMHINILININRSAFVLKNKYLHERFTNIQTFLTAVSNNFPNFN